MNKIDESIEACRRFAAQERSREEIGSFLTPHNPSREQALLHAANILERVKAMAKEDLLENEEITNSNHEPRLCGAEWFQSKLQEIINP